MGPTSFPLAFWGTFYEIVGSAVGALTGLQFVVITLMAQTQAMGSERELRAFGTPTVVHFCAALLISGIMSAPWQTTQSAGWCLGICATSGLAYSCATAWHARRAAYSPDAADWFWYTVLPPLAYAGLVLAAILLRRRTVECLFLIAAIALAFLFVGIHNSWDTVTYIALQRRQKAETERTGGS